MAGSGSRRSRQQEGEWRASEERRKQKQTKWRQGIAAGKGAEQTEVKAVAREEKRRVKWLGAKQKQGREVEAEERGAGKENRGTGL